MSKSFNPTKQNFKLLEDRIQITGMAPEIDKLHDQMAKEYEELKREYPDQKTLHKYIPLAKAVRNVTENDFIWLAKFISNHKKIHKVHELCSQFIKKGFEVLPKEYLSAQGQGGFFKWHPNPDYYLIELPRGIGKTMDFHCIKLIDMLARNPSHKYMITHADITRSQKNLSSVRGLMMNQYLSLIRPELFCSSIKEFRKIEGNRCTNFVIDVNYNGDIISKDYIERAEFRGEESLMVSSIHGDPTGYHYEGIFADDLVNDKTSANPTVTKNLIDYIQSLDSLEEYGGNHKFFVWFTGTEWYEKSAYDWIKERKKITVFQMPATWMHENERQYIAPFVTDDWLESKKDKQPDWYNPHRLMIPRPYDSDVVELSFSEEEHVVHMTEKEFEGLRANSMVAQICDPAYSKKDKQDGDAKSRFTIINALVNKDGWYIYDCFQTPGEHTGKIREYNTDKCIDNGTEFFVQDAQGLQGGLYDELEQNLKDLFPWMMFYKHDSSPLTNTTDKVKVANKVLDERFSDGEIKCIVTPKRAKNMQPVIDQFSRTNLGMDIIDCTVYMVADIDRYTDVTIAMAKRKNRINKIQNRHKKKTGSNVRVFRRLA